MMAVYLFFKVLVEVARKLKHDQEPQKVVFFEGNSPNMSKKSRLVNVLYFGQMVRVFFWEDYLSKTIYSDLSRRWVTPKGTE